MRLILLTAIKEWIVQKIKFGPNLWQQISDESGFGAERFSPQDSVSSMARLQHLLDIISKKLAMTKDEVTQKFLEFWLTDFGPRLYQSLSKKTDSIKEFMLNITKLNNELCNLFPRNSYIDKLDVHEIHENVYTVTYSSEKSLVDIIAVLRGAGSIFNEPFNVKKISVRSIEVRFENKG